MGFVLLGLEGAATMTLAEGLAEAGTRPIGIVLGAEGPGLREKTQQTCDRLVRIPYPGGFGSLNVSNAAAVALYAASVGRMMDHACATAASHPVAGSYVFRGMADRNTAISLTVPRSATRARPLARALFCLMRSHAAR